ncbi:unnamed protein product [Vitrella brassicaformis CCMP3155]|uniref:C3H1-type domain-containing protein n=2 Tax=Vitrella brassicaformis TaxID=1169539 RepID=A0A0G4EMD7_VITBC|nr:unnamed protein product [Vitrella brassicaformis CCMP3155]|eukprot:CEL98123.1 unnamed protein product [Vitrella brassicaformis CCMP3155]
MVRETALSANENLRRLSVQDVTAMDEVAAKFNAALDLDMREGGKGAAVDDLDDDALSDCECGCDFKSEECPGIGRRKSSSGSHEEGFVTDVDSSPSASRGASDDVQEAGGQADQGKDQEKAEAAGGVEAAIDIEPCACGCESSEGCPGFDKTPPDEPVVPPLQTAQAEGSSDLPPSLSQPTSPVPQSTRGPTDIDQHVVQANRMADLPVASPDPPASPVRPAIVGAAPSLPQPPPPPPPPGRFECRDPACFMPLVQSTIHAPPSIVAPEWRQPTVSTPPASTASPSRSVLKSRKIFNAPARKSTAERLKSDSDDKGNASSGDTLPSLSSILLGSKEPQATVEVSARAASEMPAPAERISNKERDSRVWRISAEDSDLDFALKRVEPERFAAANAAQQPDTRTSSSGPVLRSSSEATGGSSPQNRDYPPLCVIDQWLGRQGPRDIEDAPIPLIGIHMRNKRSAGRGQEGDQAVSYDGDRVLIDDDLDEAIDIELIEGCGVAAREATEDDSAGREGAGRLGEGGDDTDGANKKKRKRLRMCKFFKQGICSRGASCPFLHKTVQQMLLSVDDNPKLKTRMCPLLKAGICKRSSNECKFAHSLEELRGTDDLYKTQLCAFWLAGYCRAGDSCRHAHGEQDLRTSHNSTPCASPPPVSVMPQPLPMPPSFHPHYPPPPQAAHIIVVNQQQQHNIATFPPPMRGVRPL